MSNPLHIYSNTRELQEAEYTRRVWEWCIATYKAAYNETLPCDMDTVADFLYFMSIDEGSGGKGWFGKYVWPEISPFLPSASDPVSQEVYAFMKYCFLEFLAKYCNREWCVNDDAYIWEMLYHALSQHKHQFWHRTKALLESAEFLDAHTVTDLYDFKDIYNETVETDSTVTTDAESTKTYDLEGSTSGTETATTTQSANAIHKDFPQTKLVTSETTDSYNYATSGDVGTTTDSGTTSNSSTSTKEGTEAVELDKSSVTDTDTEREMTHEGRRTNPLYIWERYHKALAPLYDDMEKVLKPLLYKLA